MTTSSPPLHESPPLRLLALDADDLAVISANLQDALIAVSDIAYLPREKRFVLAGKRFDWVKAASGGCQRCAVGLHFERVRNVTRTGFAQSETARVLNLLAITFAPTDAPAGQVTLAFSDGAAIRLEVECLEARLADLGERYPCNKPHPHPLAADTAD